MIESKNSGLSVWFFESLSKAEEICHFVSIRAPGNSGPPYDSLNLSFTVGDDPKSVLKNRTRLTKALGIPLASLTTAKQIHDGHVKIVSRAMRGRGSTDYEGAIGATDAMVTNVPGICLMILLADCVPILFYDPSKRVVGVAHAGWKGTLGLIARKTVAAFKEHFDCAPEDILAGIGPSIGPCCYEVGQEVITRVEHVFGNRQGYVGNESAGGKGYLDLWTANQKQLIQAGIPERNIEVARVCTYHHSNLFFSHRYEKGKTGRFGAGIFIRGE
jgi:YfiH family protein